MTTIGKKKLTYSLWSLIYLVLTAVIVISATSLFNNFYYESVYVSGSSMDPTLSGNGASERFGSDYGIIDKDAGAKRNVKRYQIVTTYFPGEDPGNPNVSYKIKRVIVKPLERFKVEDNNLYIYNEAYKNVNNGWGEPLKMPFDRNGITNVDTPIADRNWPDTTLSSDQYFLAGDNWVSSYDSFSVGPVSYSSLVGVVVKMQGRCTVQNGKVVEKQSYEDRYFLGVDY